MNNKLEEIRENINHIRTIPGGYNTANYSLLIEYVLGAGRRCSSEIP